MHHFLGSSISAKHPLLKWKTVEERLKPTTKVAGARYRRYHFVAQFYSFGINIAIGLQVALGALITGLAAVTTGRSTTVITAILGGSSTLTASFLAKAKGSGEPENSRNKSEELENVCHV
ncbi:hypothetical protein SISNIDRAFT_446507 [Sistotremastrum niveocremeum HHB9708]|uniref:SMODS and SLOG-associating 2TM effector domain-containing protein n=1 Tax=Sistotremastrum niveocremeum HHB9708 TaxID=1314777 RepID=A0A164NNC1_9AGAM|nr:hypothetical protein SISNIDRAFT_446507 [Sistotremastrum niveocremeum HHB9708]